MLRYSLQPGRERIRWKAVPFLVSALALSIFAGCTAVPVQQQRLVSKPNMLFSDSTVFNYYSKLFNQIESGAAVSGGAQAAGCTSCR